MEDEKKNESITDTRDVPYFVHEGIVARLDRTVKRLWILNIIQTIIILIVIGVFVWYLNQYDYECYTVTASDDGYANYIGNDGDIYNGERESAQESEEVGSERQGDS